MWLSKFESKPHRSMGSLLIYGACRKLGRARSESGPPAVAVWLRLILRRVAGIEQAGEVQGAPLAIAAAGMPNQHERSSSRSVRPPHAATPPASAQYDPMTVNSNATIRTHASAARVK